MTQASVDGEELCGRMRYHERTTRLLATEHHHGLHGALSGWKSHRQRGQIPI